MPCPSLHQIQQKLPSLEVSHGEVVERSVLLGYDAVSLGEWLLTFRKDVVPSFFEGLQVSEEFFLTSKDEVTRFLRNVGNPLPRVAASSQNNGLLSIKVLITVTVGMKERTL
jgi:hypothetical protein